MVQCYLCSAPGFPVLGIKLRPRVGSLSEAPLRVNSGVGFAGCGPPALSSCRQRREAEQEESLGLHV